MVIEELHRAENDLAARLLDAADRHEADHEIYRLARDLARWSQQHVRELAGIGREHGLDLDPDPVAERTASAVLRREGAESFGRRHDPELLLLHDLREIHCAAAAISLDWEILAQTAQALRDRGLLETIQRCHPQTLRQMRWADAHLKANAAQIVAMP